MSDVFEDPKEDFQYDEEKNMLRAGISFSLLQFYTHLIEKKIFLPGGVCSHVHLGGKHLEIYAYNSVWIGHVQSGGYGMVTRSFGLLADYVEGFEIVLADLEKARLVFVWKPEMHR